MNFEVGEVLTPELTLHVCWSWFHSMNGTYSVREEGVSILSLTRSRSLWRMAHRQRARVFGRGRGLHSLLRKEQECLENGTPATCKGAAALATVEGAATGRRTSSRVDCRSAAFLSTESGMPIKQLSKCLPAQAFSLPWMSSSPTTSFDVLIADSNPPASRAL